MIDNNKIQRSAALAAKWWSERLMKGDRDKFSECLMVLIVADLTSKHECFLSCDYDPQGHLLTAVTAAGIQCSGNFFSATGILPKKHMLRVTLDYLEPCEGYGNWKDKIPVQ